MKRCKECVKVNSYLISTSIVPYKDYPAWYREGKNCPECGAGGIPEIMDSAVVDSEGVE